MMNRSWFWSVVLVVVGAACSSSDRAEDAAMQRQALASPESVLGFEDPAQWSASSGSVSPGAERSEGSGSVAVSIQGYTEVTSVELESVGPVGTTASLDIRLEDPVPWGEVRLIVIAPSLGEWRDLGGRALGGLAADGFHSLSFTIPEDLRTKLQGTFSDLKFRIVVNAPSGQYTLDRLRLGGPSVARPTFFTFSVELPAGTAPHDLVVGASERLDISDRVTLLRDGAPAAVYSAQGGVGVGDVELGVNTIVAAVTAGDDVSLSSGARVTGDVVAGGLIHKQAGAVVGGAELEEQAVETDVISWREQRPNLKGDILLEPTATKAIVPGAYGAVRVQSGADLYLRAGKYFFATLTVEPGAELILEDTGGPVFIYVESALTHRGIIRGLGARVPDLLVGFSGEGTALIEGGLPGTLVAPNGTVRLQPAPAGGHQGAYYAEELVIEPDTVVQHRAFPWEVVLPPDLSGIPPVRFDPSPVVLIARKDHDPVGATPGTATPAGPVTFEIPARIPLTGGNAGNATATLTFTDPSGTLVTCTYRGGASLLSPQTLLEIARGREYRFESCSNGQVAGDTAVGTDFGLDIDGDPQSPWGATEAELALGENTCSGFLEPLISSAESLQMVEGFSWQNTQALPEVNPEGHPTLYYANIYLRNHEELDRLKRLFIHFQAKPLFVSELSQYRGQCGTLHHEGDGQGMFVYAVIPGATYNRIRAATTHPDIPVEDRILFRAIIQRDAPSESVHPDGSLRYDRLAEAGFYYMGLRDMPPREALDEELLGGGDVISVIVDSMEFVAEVAYTVGTTAVRVLGAIDRFIFGSVRVTVAVNVLNRDPAFDRNGVMQRAWGPDALDAMNNPQPLGLPGVQVEVLQWAVRPLGIYPTNSYHRTNYFGVASMEVGKSQGGILGGTSSRGTSGICIEMANNAAEFISGLLPNEVCDFREDPKFNGFDEDVVVPVETDDYDAHALNQISEAYTFISASGHIPRQARVLTGHTAAVLSEELDSGFRRLWAPCLGFPGAFFDLVQYISGGLVPWKRMIVDGEVGEGLLTAFGGPWYLGQLDDTDILMPRNSRASSSRSIMVHEYGHFLKCSLLHELDPEALGTMTVDILLEGGEVDPNDDARVLHETFADFIAAQVTGSTNYFSPNAAATTTSGAMSFCDGRGVCLESKRRDDRPRTDWSSLHALS